MASSNVGGLSGAFIPVSEDAGMIDAAVDGTLTLTKLEAMTSVCSVGLDMIAVPGDIEASTISAIIADEMAIGMVNNKTTAVRLIPAIGLKEGRYVGIRRFVRQCTSYACKAEVRCKVHCTRRSHSGTDAQHQELMGEPCSSIQQI